MVNEQTDAKCWAKIVGRVAKMPWALPHIHLNTNKLIKWRPVRWCGKINCGFAKRSVFETPTHEIQFYAQSSHSIRDFCFFFISQAVFCTSSVRVIFWHNFVAQWSNEVWSFSVSFFIRFFFSLSVLQSLRKTLKWCTLFFSQWLFF